MTGLDSNGKDKKVKSKRVSVLLQDIVEGMEFQSESVTSYLNTVTKEIEPISEETLAAVEAGENIDPLTGELLDTLRSALTGTGLIQLPDCFEINEYRMMERFAYSLVDQSVSDAISTAIQGSGAFRRFKDTVRHFGLADKWYEFRKHAYKEIAVDWCEEKGIEYHR